MKAIIKAYLEFATGKLSTFDGEYEQFIKYQPIGEAEQAIIGEIYNRARVGFKKYGCTTDREDFTPQQWAKNAQEEALDMAIYLTKLL